MAEDCRAARVFEELHGDWCPGGDQCHCVTWYFRPGIQAINQVCYVVFQSIDYILGKPQP